MFFIFTLNQRTTPSVSVFIIPSVEGSFFIFANISLKSATELSATMPASAMEFGTWSKLLFTNRAFSTRPIPREMLEQIIEAAHRAPTASNMQQVYFTLVTDPKQLDAISRFTLDVFNSAAKKLKNPILKPILKRIMPDAYRYLPVFDRLKREYANGHDMILRGATAALFIHTPKNSRFGSADANLAYQNGSLMAECLGVNQFYMGFVCTAIHQENKGTLANMLGINGTIHAAMALGMPEFRFSNYIDKKDTIETDL